MSCNLFDPSQAFRCQPKTAADSDNITLFGNTRIAVGVALFFGMLVHYISTFFIHGKGKGSKEEFIHVERVFVLFGAACILSFNLIQSGVYQGIFAWFTLITLIFIHLPALGPATFVGARNKFWMAFYFFLWMWYWGIIIDFYDNYAKL